MPSDSDALPPVQLLGCSAEEAQARMLGGATLRRGACYVAVIELEFADSALARPSGPFEALVRWDGKAFDHVGNDRETSGKCTPRIPDVIQELLKLGLGLGHGVWLRSVAASERKLDERDAIRVG